MADSILTMRSPSLLASLLCVLTALPSVAQTTQPSSSPTTVQSGIQTDVQTGVQSPIQTQVQSGAQVGLQPIIPAPVAPGFDSLAHPTIISSPLTQPTLSPGVLLLMELEGRFAKSVAAGGGKAFASWFADDAVTLNNGRPAVLGRVAITTEAQWDPKAYQLTWTPQGAQMGPSNDMGFTWGHYEGRSKDKNGEPTVITGRYFTVWKKLPDGSWKVALDASANEPPNANECCTLPKP